MTGFQRIFSTAAGLCIAAILVLSAAWLYQRIRHAPPIPSLANIERPPVFSPIDVPVAELPWKRHPDRPERLTTYVPIASLPRMPIHHDPDRPVRIFLRAAEVPWTRQLPVNQPVTLGIAHVPHLPVHRDLGRPNPVETAIAAVPWTRSAHTPAPVQLATADLPNLKPKRDPANPNPTTIPLANLPWTRNMHAPTPVEIPQAHVPTGLKPIVTP